MRMDTAASVAGPAFSIVAAEATTDSLSAVDNLCICILYQPADQRINIVRRRVFAMFCPECCLLDREKSTDTHAPGEQR
jgi:hypothetical protein